MESDPFGVMNFVLFHDSACHRRRFSENRPVPVSTSHRREQLASIQLPGTVWLGSAPVDPVRRLPTGLTALDQLLGGGLPRGHLSEIAGAASSGRTALLHALLASATLGGEVAAVVDVLDALDPASLARAGADLTRVLWVRPPSAQVGLKCAELILCAGGFGLVTLDGLDVSGRRTGTKRTGPPLAAHVWPRLAQVAKRADAVVVLLAGQRLAGGTAALALTLTQRRVRWSGPLFEGVTTTAALARSRFGPAERAITLALGEQLAALGEVKVEPLRMEERGRGGGSGNGRVARQ